MTNAIPRLRSDAEAEALLGGDLSNVDFSQSKPAHFAFDPTSERVNMRLPKSLLSAVKGMTLAKDIPSQRFIRQALEQAVASGKKAS